MGQILVASAPMRVGERGEEEFGTGEIGEEFGGELAGTTGVGVGTVFGAGVGLHLQPHGIMGLMTEPADNHSGRATDGCGSTYVSERTICSRLSLPGAARSVSETAQFARLRHRQRKTW
jgi:hypothetical protein